MEALAAWSKEQSADLRRNEADTRLHLIDQLLFDCLGWHREDCHAEEQFNGTYTDYTFLTPRKFVLEAKREGIYFDLPAGFNKQSCKIATLADADSAVDSAIRQAMRYCQERSIPLGAVCNGHQLIAFLGSRPDGIPPMSGICLVFNSLEQMLANFRTLWDNLSRPGVLAYTLHSTLKGDGVQPPPEKLSSRIPGYPVFKNRNPFQTELKILGDLFIEDVVRAPQLEQEFLEKCYSQSGALSQYASISRQILQARYSSLFERELAGPTLEPVSTKDGLSEHFVDDVLAASLKRRAIVLLGDVGVGKSIFIRHLIKVSAQDVFENALPLYIDFGKEPALAENLEGFVLSSCAAQLYKAHKIDIEENGFVRGVYHGELLRFRKGIYGSLAETDPAAFSVKEIEFLSSKLNDRAAHLRACLTHISKGHKRQIVVFLDNIDQRPIEFQDRVFLIGQSLAETWPATVFISLRPDTFNSSRMKGSLAAYQPRVFTISPPRVDSVIKLRLQFVLSYLQDTGHLSSLGPNLSVRSDSLLSYVEVLITSFKKSHQLVEFIDNLSGGNTRRALDFLMTFIGSGHVNAEKILNIAREQGYYTISIHEFMRAVIFGDFEHYDPSASPVANAFDISSPDGKEHFLLPNILAFVDRTGRSVQEGFVEAEKVHQFCQSLGFFPAQIEISLKRALDRRLLEASPQFSEDPPLAYRITTVGSYTYKELPHFFSYLDAMTVDTPIVDRDVRANLIDSRLLPDRLNRGELFRKYLDAQHMPLNEKSFAFDWLSASKI
ncbi:MAG: hypothetical protein JRN15_23055, partial [Nitrososphaerota archaeon]|nr:hypothetical protein [Nitrososphaerota archaeon]